MVKIKTKKKMNLPQLIEWGFENNIKRATYMSENGLTVDFSFDGKAVIGYAFSKDDLFSFEAEEEITEETALEHIVEINTHGEHLLWDNSKIANIIDYESEEFHAYIDGEFKLIWRDGKLVE